ncbi:hypothetical protein CEXT_798831 [Caerostris extrusa]|uniref:Uncharacterized protein n=1 Tax=Caerostris extrusa TaxID=172846 RepID=A0AAV4W666_CAEEX|nr:hypothetical protein CEXT_798831 [Caerostris extrusa]
MPFKRKGEGMSAEYIRYRHGRMQHIGRKTLRWNKNFRFIPELSGGKKWGKVTEGGTLCKKEGRERERRKYVPSEFSNNAVDPLLSHLSVR